MRKRQIELLILIETPSSPCQKFTGIEVEMNVSHILARQQRKRVVHSPAAQPIRSAGGRNFDCIAKRHGRYASGLLVEANLWPQPVVPKRPMRAARIRLRQKRSRGPPQLYIAEHGELQEAVRGRLRYAMRRPGMVPPVLELQHSVLGDVRGIRHGRSIGIRGDRIRVTPGLLSHPLRRGWQACDQTQEHGQAHARGWPHPQGEFHHAGWYQRVRQAASFSEFSLCLWDSVVNNWSAALL